MDEYSVTGTDRFYGPVLGSVELQSTFAGDTGHSRMNRLRQKIQAVRAAWSSDIAYGALIDSVKICCKIDTLPEQVKTPLQRLLHGYRDYADSGIEREGDASDAHLPGQYEALELYCTPDGYNYLYSLMSQTLRAQNATEEMLLTATVLVEFLTIDLYNLRLSQIGDERYSNFQGVVYRGMRVESSRVQEYVQILNNPDLAKRSFAVPIGLISSTTDEKVMQEFAAKEEDESVVQMYWTIHVHGIDPHLMKLYRRRYPDSVVTSICAMPVAMISPCGEKEILLRGAFFHLIGIEHTTTSEGVPVTKVVAVMMNSNRDHSSELALDTEEKTKQRQCFSRLVAASKYEVCASLATNFSTEDAVGYSSLQGRTLEEIRLKDGFKVSKRDDLADARSKGSAVWLGSVLTESYPRHYATARHRWQDAIANEDWSTARIILNNEYDWHRSNWFNVGILHHDPGTIVNDNTTILHHIASKPPPKDADMHIAWEWLLEVARTSAWKTLRTNLSPGKTAYDLARELGSEHVAEMLRPRILHQFPREKFSRLQQELHRIMNKEAGDHIERYACRLPQLSVLTEMLEPSLWVPIPHWYGGFVISLDAEDESLHMKIFRFARGRVLHEEFNVILK